MKIFKEDLWNDIVELKSEGKSLHTIADELYSEYGGSRTPGNFYEHIRHIWGKQLRDDNAVKEILTMAEAKMKAEAEISRKEDAENAAAPDADPEENDVFDEFGIDEKELFNQGYTVCRKQRETGGNIGSTFEKGFIAVIGNKSLSQEEVMQAYKLNTKEWTPVSYTLGFYSAQSSKRVPKSIAPDGYITMWTSKLTVKPKKGPELTLKDLDEYFEKKDFSKNLNNVKVPDVIPYDPTQEILEIDYADPHIGLFAWANGTGADFNVCEAERRFRACIADEIKRCKGRQFSLVRFVTLGDIIHVDNDRQETTAGTFQQTDSPVDSLIDRAADLIIWGLETLMENLNVPVEYVYLSGNHDKLAGACVAKIIKTYFRGNPNIQCDVSENPQKIKWYGKSLVGYTHGNMPKKNVGTWIQTRYKAEYGQALYAEEHVGHLHSESSGENVGVMVRHLPTICESSYWENQQGYESKRAFISYVWNQETGLRETWVYNF